MIGKWTIVYIALLNIIYLFNASVTHSRLWLPIAIRQRYPTKWKSRIAILNDRECPIIVGTLSWTFVSESYRSGRSAKHSRQLRASCNIREIRLILSNQITIVTMSGQILLYRIKNVTMSCIFWTVFCWSGECRDKRARFEEI